MSMVTIKGQITIPRKVREHLQIIPGQSDVEFVILENGHVELLNKSAENVFEKVRGLYKGTMSTDEIMALTRGEAQ